MKLIVIQLSDMHCEATADSFTRKMEQAVSAIKSQGPFDRAVVVFSGDLTDTANKNEFKAARKVMGYFLSEIGKLVNSFVCLMIVPGNHDMYLPEDSRGVKEIESWDKDEHLPEELERLKQFYNYARSKNCFKKNQLCDNRTINVNGLKIQFCLLNSAPYSTRTPDDKELHYFPPYVADMTTRNAEAQLKITIMHHHFEWFEWSSKEMLKKAIASDDVTFFGHDHKSEASQTHYSNGDDHSIIVGGRFNLNTHEETAFNAVVFNSEDSSIERIEFNWSIEEGIFVPSRQGIIKKKNFSLSPSSDFVEKLVKDTHKISKCFTDYYTIPKLAVEGSAFSSDDFSDSIGVEDIFSILDRDKVIRITGTPGAGKTALLRYLYKESIDRDYLPILVENRDYRDSRIDKMFKDLFDEQYRLPYEHAYEHYVQADDGKKIVFIDNADLISNKKARDKLFSDIIDSGKLLVFTTTEKNQDLVEIVKAKLQEKAASTIDILPMYKETRDILVERVGQIQHKTANDINAIKSALDYMAQCQTGFFSFSPENVLQYIIFFMRGGAQEHKGTQTISLVFENNIKTSILEQTNDTEATLFLSALDYLADKMYFEMKAVEIDVVTLNNLISEFNEKRKAKINSKAFLNTCKSANIIKDGKEPFHVCFYDNSTYAYFVAHALNREFEKDHSNRTKLNYVMEHICFGINDSIIIFLSFIRSNIAIILMIARKAMELLEDYPMWDFEERNIPFLHEKAPIPDTLPTKEEAKAARERVEQVEQERHEAIQFRGIFDYDETDVNKTVFRVQRAHKYVQLVGRALVDQYGSFEADEIDEMIAVLLSAPLKVVYAVLKPYQDHYDDIVSNILAFIKQERPDEAITEEHIRRLLSQSGTNLALNILNDIAFNASNGSTITALRDVDAANATQKIMQLLMEENTGNTPEFVNRAILLREELDKIPYAQLLIALIARKHIIYTGDIDHRQIDKLQSGKVLSKKSKSSLLVDKRKLEKS